MSPESAAAGAAEIVLGPDRRSGGGEDEPRAGLAESPRRIPHRYGYDAAGSRLFEEISRLPAYCPPRAERRVLRDHGADMVRLSGAGELVHLGVGSAEKPEIPPAAMETGGPLRAYTGIDVSVRPMREAARLTIVHGDFATALPWLKGRGTGCLMALPGSTFGCLTPPEQLESFGFLCRRHWVEEEFQYAVLLLS